MYLYICSQPLSPHLCVARGGGQRGLSRSALGYLGYRYTIGTVLHIEKYYRRHVYTYARMYVFLSSCMYACVSINVGMGWSRSSMCIYASLEWHVCMHVCMYVDRSHETLLSDAGAPS